MWYILKIENDGSLSYFYGFNSQHKAIWRAAKRGLKKYGSYEEAEEDRDYFSTANTVIERV